MVSGCGKKIGQLYDKVFDHILHQNLCKASNTRQTSEIDKLWIGFFGCRITEISLNSLTLKASKKKRSEFNSPL